MEYLATKADVMQALDEWWQHTQVPSAPNELDTLSYARSVVKRKLDLHSISRATALDYEKSLNAWNDYLQDVPLRDVTPTSIERALKSWLAHGKAETTVRKRYVALNMALSAAVADGLVSDNVMDGIPRPKVAATQHNALSAVERERLRSALERVPLSPWVVGVSLCLYAGLRSEESCGLQVSDVDLTTRTIYVRRAIAYGQGGSYVAPPKSNKFRDVPICDSLYGVLARWIESARPSLWLLGSSERYLCARRMGRQFSAFCDFEGIVGEAGRKPSLHDLRHTFASACVSRGMDVKTLQSILGHASAAITLDTYCSVDKEAKRAACVLIEQAI